MKDHRRAGQSTEQLHELVDAFIHHAPLELHGRMGCPKCAMSRSQFLVYPDVLVCVYCKSRFALKRPILGKGVPVSQRLLCQACRRFRWAVEKRKLYCKCGEVLSVGREIEAIPLFDYDVLPEAVTFGMNALAEIKRCRFDD